MKRCPQCGQMFEDNVRFCPTDGGMPVPVGTGEDSDPLLGIVLGGKYRLEKKVGEGGMGKIYLSRHITLNKRYAVKMLNPEYSNNQEAIERFRREAVTAGELEHPNIINVTDIDYTTEGQAYIVMEYLDGRELREDLRNTPVVDPQRALRILYQVARALDAAHAKGIIHRDLKPENIFLIDRADQKDVVKILDFGISKIKGARASNLTQTGMVIGTPHYMAPEQARGDRDIDTRVDIYALGSIAYEMFTGRLPVNGESPTAILMKILLEEPPPPETVNPNLPPAISAAIRTAMAKDPSARYQTCMQFVDALRGALQVQQEAFMTGSISAPVVATMTSQRQRPPSALQAVPVIAQPGSGPVPAATGATPMTWTGGQVSVEPPAKKSSKAVFIVIPIVLLLLVGGGVGGYLIYANMAQDGKTGGTGGGKAASTGTGDVTGDKGTAKVDQVETKVPDKTTGGTEDVAAEDKTAIIKFRTDPEGATVMLKTGIVERELCKTECEYEFEKSKKDMDIVFTKTGYHDEELEIAADVPYKEVVLKLTEKSKKKKAGGSKVSIVTKDEKPSGSGIPTEKDKKAPIIRPIEDDGKTGTTPVKDKKKPQIRIIP